MDIKKLMKVEFEVFGKVQGVFFRKYTRDKARELGLRGWCANTTHRSVYGIMEGEIDAIEKMDGININRCVYCYKEIPSIMKRCKPVVYTFPMPVYHAVKKPSCSYTKQDINHFILRERYIQKHNPENLAPENDAGCIPFIPLPSKRNYCKMLPIYKYRQDILNAVKDSQVVIIFGGVGYGKSTQIPQYLLEDAYSNSKGCRIMCCEPYPIMALNICGKISSERKESVGKSVGYQIPLETRVSATTALLYVTPSVLVSTLLFQKSDLSAVTHIIIDTSDERQCIIDFLFIALRDILTKYQHMKLIFIQNSNDISAIQLYFNCKSYVRITANEHPESNVFYLQDILRLTGYKQLEAIISDGNINGKMVPINHASKTSTDCETLYDKNVQLLFNVVMETGADIAFIDLINMMRLRMLSVNHRHAKSGMTLITLACFYGKINFLDILLKLGADITIQCKEGLSPIKWAEFCKEHQIVERLRQHISFNRINMTTDTDIIDSLSEPEIKAEEAEDRVLLKNYYSTINHEETVDIDLLVALIAHIHGKGIIGDILVFLPSFSEILALRNALYEKQDKITLCGGKFQIYALYAEMQTHYQKDVFNEVPLETRKIILSTDMGIHCFKSNKLVFVIDTGKIEQKVYNNQLEIFSVDTTWASKKSVDQRAACIGRYSMGYCYRLYPQAVYSKMNNSPTCDMKCSSLQKLEALDQDEHLTDLGQILLQLPVEPQYGKMILCALALKCIDPILTITACLTHRLLSNIDKYKFISHIVSKKWAELSDNTLSDHSVLIKLFLRRQITGTEKKAKECCDEMYVDAATMELVNATRTNLVGHLRSLGFIKVKQEFDMKDCNTNSEKWSVVKAALVAGNYPNTAYIDHYANKIKDSDGREITLCPWSVLLEYTNSGKLGLYDVGKVVPKLKTNWLIYNQMNCNPLGYCASTCTVVSSLSLMLFAGPESLSFNKENQNLVNYITNNGAFVSGESDSEDDNPVTHKKLKFVIDGNLQFYMDKMTATYVIFYRTKWFSYFNKRLNHRSLTVADKKNLETIVSMLEIEDQCLGFSRPVGIGNKPQIFTINVQDQRSLDDLEQNDHSFETSARLGVLPMPARLKQWFLLTDSLNFWFFISAKSDMEAIRYSLENNVWKFDLSADVKALEVCVMRYPVTLFFVLADNYFCGYGILVNDGQETSFELCGKNNFHASVHWLKEGLVSVGEVQELMSSFLENITDGQEINIQMARCIMNLWNFARPSIRHEM